MPDTIYNRIASELKISASLVETVAGLFDEGNTLPFIARYRKEMTAGADEVLLSQIRERVDYYRELADRKATILETIAKQEKLTPELKAKIESCFDKYELEDLYLPYKPKRRNRAQVARELGLEPLALRILSQEDETDDPEQIARVFGLSVNLPDPGEALKGALDIVAEMICENPEIRQSVRDLMWREGMIQARLVVDKEESSGKYDAFHNQNESVRDIPSHRMLAIFRGSKEKQLAFRITVDSHEVFSLLDHEVIRNERSIWRRHLLDATRDCYERLLAPQIETEIRAELKRRADEVAVDVFAQNLRVLLLQPPLMGKVVLALDPGLRTGCKLCVVDTTGKFLCNETIYPLEPKKDVNGAGAVLSRLIQQHGVTAIAVGNGTGGKEAFRFVRSYLKESGQSTIVPVMVSESGASIYSASDIAREEFPALDLTVRGAISIGRRLQDPLAELVKIDPKSIGVGQYQHDVDQKHLARKLDEVVEYCVNAVGVDLNTASVPLLARVAGLNARVAGNVVSFRSENGPFTNRTALLKVPQLGEKTFQQAAGFLRVVGDDPLDNSAVHPERYDLVRRMAADLGVDVKELIGNTELVSRIDRRAYLSEAVGEYTLNDILEELKKPNRDPREDFSVPEFKDEINDIRDLEEGMELEGVVTNVANFGVFVDIGVHQDGMIHVSELDHRFVSDPSQIIKVGDKVRVKVIELDKERKRIGLSRRALLEPPARPPRPAPKEAAAPPREQRESRESRDQRPPRPEQRGGPKGDRRPGQAPRGDKQPARDEIASGRMAELLKAALKKDDAK